MKPEKDGGKKIIRHAEAKLPYIIKILYEKIVFKLNRDIPLTLSNKFGLHLFMELFC